MKRTLLTTPPPIESGPGPRDMATTRHGVTAAVTARHTTISMMARAWASCSSATT